MDESLLRDLESAVEKPDSLNEGSEDNDARPSEEIIARSERLAPDVTAKLTAAQKNALIKAIKDSKSQSDHASRYSASLFMRAQSASPTAAVLIRLGLAKSVDDHKAAHPEEDHVDFRWGAKGVLTPLGEEVAAKLYQEAFGDDELESLAVKRDDRLRKIREDRERRAEEIRVAFAKLDLMKDMTEGLSYSHGSREITINDRNHFLNAIKKDFDHSVSRNQDVRASLFASDDLFYQLITSMYKLGQSDSRVGEDRLKDAPS